MPLKPLRECHKHGCTELTRSTYCDEHKDETEKKKANWNRSYDRNRRANASFYKSPAWKRVREQAYKRDGGLCQVCVRSGKVKTADVVHHIIEVKEDWNKRFDLTNLESVCHTCHNRIHKG